VAFTRATDTITITTPGGAVSSHAAGGTARFMPAQNPTVAYPVIRTRALGKLYALQLVAGNPNTVAAAVFGNEVTANYPVHVIGSNSPGAVDSKGVPNYTLSTASTVGNNLAIQTDLTKNDPKVIWTSDSVKYVLDPVDDLQPGTYIAKIELADRGIVDAATNWKTPTVARIQFQVKTATEELPPAANCGSCHTDPTDTVGMVFDAPRHNKLLNNTGVDLCGNCHDYQPQNPTGDWSGALPIAKRVHAVHYGANLTYPLLTVGHADEIPGRNWDIQYPQDIRTCDTTCHTSSGPNKTSGTWKTKPARLPCSGCHDDDAARAHMKAMTFDPTPNDPFSGDEQESCATCH
jgi:hypothetical protein